MIKNKIAQFPFLNIKFIGFGLGVLCFLGCASLGGHKTVQPADELKTLSQNIQQAIIVEPQSDSQAVLTAWELKNGRWFQKYSSMPAMVGRSGIAEFQMKREGDGKTPSGIFEIKLAFGYDQRIDTKLMFRQATENDFWVDDVKSPQYNQWVVGKPNASSFEDMKRKDSLYKLGAVIEYNTGPIIPGYGSAIFLHIWKENGKSTSGCVALAEENVKQLLAWLDVKRSPVIIIKTHHKPS